MKNIYLRIFIVLTIVGILLHSNSFKISLFLNELAVMGSNVVIHDQHHSPIEFKIVETKNRDGKLAIARVVKDKFGIWHTEDINYSKELYENVHIAGAAWIFTLGARRYDSNVNAEFVKEFHSYYSGIGAKKLIHIPSEMIPSNVVISVTQAGEAFQIKVTKSSDSEDGLIFDPTELLHDLGVFDI